MIDFFSAYQSLFNHILVYVVLAMSQYVVLRAGVFSLGSAAFCALGSYACALLVVKLGWHPLAAMAAGTCLGAIASGLLALPLSRLRGVFQAVATLALVEIVLSATTNWVSLTGGAQGVNDIPHYATTPLLIAVVAACTLLLVAMGRFSIGRAMDIIREDETVAVSLGISVPRHQRIAFVLSGALAGLSGGLYALSSYAIVPTDFGFGLLVMVLAMVVLGGRTTVWGPFVGAVILTSLPEIFRVFSEYRHVMQGILLMIVIIYLPRGVADTLIGAARDRRLRRKAAAANSGAPAPNLIKTEAGVRP